MIVASNPMRPPSDGEKGRVRIEISLSQKAAEDLVSMKKNLGHDNLAATVRAAVRLLYEVVKGRRDGLEVCLRDPKTGVIRPIKII